MDPMQWVRQAQLMRSAMLRNPKASRQAQQTFDAQAKAYLGERELLDSQFPGRAPDGSGATGLMPNDSYGYRQMLEEQQARQGLTSYLKGGSPQPQVKYGGDAPGTDVLPSMAGITKATGRNNSASFLRDQNGAGLPAWVGGQEIDGAIRQATDAATKSGLKPGVNAAYRPRF